MKKGNGGKWSATCSDYIISGERDPQYLFSRRLGMAVKRKKSLPHLEMTSGCSPVASHFTDWVKSGLFMYLICRSEISSLVQWSSYQYTSFETRFAAVEYSKQGSHFSITSLSGTVLHICTSLTCLVDTFQSDNLHCCSCSIRQHVLKFHFFS